MKKFAWSFSSLEQFESCSKKYYHLRVIRDFKAGTSDAMQEGRETHDALYNRVCNDAPLPIPLRPYEPMAQRFVDAKGEKHGEMKLALNDKFQPVEFFAKDVWVRAVLDLTIVQGTTALITDWKTGKQKEGFDQLRLAAAILSRYMPEIEEFKLAYVWLKDREITMDAIHKDEMKSVWMEYLPRVKNIERAMKTTTFPANSTPLCGWCPVDTCPHWVDRG